MENEKPTEERSVVQQRLNWQVASRDDTKVGQALYAGETIEEMHHLSDAGLLDEFFVFLKDLGMLEAFEQVSQSGVKRTLNTMVQLLARRGWFAGKLLVALDGSKVPTPESYEGCGKLKQTRKVKVKGQKEPVTQEYYLYGWKVLVLIEVQTRLPLAMKLVPIQDYEGKWLVPLLEQAQQNLGTQAHIGTIVVDRGYLDGEDLWRVHQKGVIFVICGKASMAVTQDAQGVAKGERAILRAGVVRRGHGKTAKDQRLRTELVGLEALTSYDQYGDVAYTQNAHHSDYVGQPINAVVVRKWENRVPQTGGTVYLTNGEVRDPFVVFDTYDWR